MKKIITSFALALTSLCLSAEDLSFRGQTDKDPLLYKLGEEIVFRVSRKLRRARLSKGENSFGRERAMMARKRMAKLFPMSRSSLKRKSISLVSCES